MGLDSPVVPIGWHRNSAYPGTGGNVALSGHSNIAGEVFRYLMALEMGDKIDFYPDDAVHPYAVRRKVLLEEEVMPAEVCRQNAGWIARPTTNA